MRTKRFLSLFMIFLTLFSFLNVFNINVNANEDTFTVAMEVDYAPFNWSQQNDSNGAVEVANSPGEFANGYDVQIAKKIAEGLGKKLRVIKNEWDGLIPGIMAGKFDAIIAGMSPTEERRTKLDFSEKYYKSDLVLVVKKGSKYDGAKKLSDFAGAKVTGQLNTHNYEAVDQIIGVDKQEAMENFTAMISAVKAQKIDAYVSERAAALSAAASNDDLTFINFADDEGFVTDENSMIVSVGLAKGSELTEKINLILAGISEDERQELMNNMVNLQAKGSEEELTFWQSVGFLLDKYGAMFLRGAGVTLLIAIIATLVGFIIGVIVSMIRCVPKSKGVKRAIQLVINFILTAYIEIIRGTPMMVQAVLFYYGSKMFFGIDVEPLTAALIVVSVNTGAYLAEVVRGGINSIDKGQFEGAKAIGMTHWQTMIYVVLPQAIKNVLPSIGNEFVINIKDTAVLNIISVTELFFTTKSVAGSTYRIFEAYLITCCIYFVLTFTVTRVIMLIEKKLKGDSSYNLVKGSGDNE